MLHILNYIHLNPLDLKENTVAWREGQIEDHKSALEFLKAYRWSSYQDYVGIKNFPSILRTDFFTEVFEGQYEKQLEEYLKDIDVSQIKYLLHE
jgi:hypothetical protein